MDVHDIHGRILGKCTFDTVCAVLYFFFLNVLGFHFHSLPGLHR